MEKETRPFISWQLADDFMTAVFEKMGVPTEDARLCADVLLESDRRGIESHGCNRFKPIYIDRIKSGILNPVTKIDILKETPTTAVLDANDGMGMVASKKAMDMCIEKAHKYGMGMVAVRNSSHYGIAGYWTGLAAKENMIGISGTNARPSVAPTFGVENMLGTNPLTFSMPTDEPFPFTLDCATSVIQNGKIEYYARINHDTPKGLVISREGEELTDSAEILKKIRSQQAALAPLGGFGETTGGYKGYGYSTVVEILSAALQSGLFLHLVHSLHGAVLHPQHRSSGLGVDLLGILAGQQLETGRAEQSTGGEQCDLLDIHSNFPTFSISCQRPCTAGPVR